MENQIGKSVHCNSHFEIIGNFPDDWPEHLVKNEPMLFSCDYESSLRLGGPITASFLASVPDDIKRKPDFVFDSRVHMLMPGWFPCIPGWHHDDVPRTTSNGQPDYFDPAYRSKHILGLVNGDICPTEFAQGEISLQVPAGIIYKQWHVEVERALEEGKLIRKSCPSGKLIAFDDRAFHQGTRAVAPGWRWFGRISYSTGRRCSNELRRQVQVYLEYPMEGW